MEYIDITHLKDKEITKMSGGEYQMILIARAMVSNPEIIIFDEPETGLDFKNQLIILNLIEKFSNDGIITIINTHYPENTFKVSNQCLLLNNSSYKLGRTDEILNKENIKESFEVDIIMADIDHESTTYKNIIPIKIAR